MASVGILIDGSNLLAQLDSCNLGYPALAPLIGKLRGTDDLAFARFYGAPPLATQFQARWQAFRDANRHIAGLSWFYGFRNSEGQEKAVDVALAVDLIRGCLTREFDRVVVIGGDGDHSYAFKEALATKVPLIVYLMPAQHASNLNAIGVTSRYFTVKDLLDWGVCDRGAQVGVPLAHKAPSGHPDVTPRYIGANARLA